MERADETADHEAVTVPPAGTTTTAHWEPGAGMCASTCSDGHGFAFVMGNHKGSEFVGVVPRV